MEEGLSKFLLFLRDELERERLEEIERLKPIGTQVGMYLEYRLKTQAAAEQPTTAAAAAASKGGKGSRSGP